MLLHDVVAVSLALQSTGSRRAKIEMIGGLLRRCTPSDARLAVAYLSGVLPQGRIGVGWATIEATDAVPTDHPVLTLEDVDSALGAAARLSGEGSDEARRRAVEGLLARATAEEQRFVVQLLLGDLRHGALEGVVADAVAHATGVPPEEVRRAVMVGGDLGEVAEAAVQGGAERLAGFRLTVFRPVRPMLAQSAADVAEALEKTGPAVVEVKYDGARVQVHASGGDVAIYTRSLKDVTQRLPEVVAAVAEAGAEQVVLDGEAILLDGSGRPRPFQETAGRFGSGPDAGGPPLTPVFFDLMALDGRDLTRSPLSERREALAGVLPTGLLVAGVVASDAGQAAGFMDRAVASGHEGVVVKALDSPYEAGRRGAAWVKVKPVHTLDLVVLAAEWGHGRRHGLLSNLHLGARDPASGSFVMLGKTFKGLTDEMLRWQTERFLSIEERRSGNVVHVRPEQVVEVAFDGVQASPRYPGGVTLRFARVRGYRNDKSAAEADTIDTVLGIHRGEAPPPAS